ncbi:MAG: class I SAM-dependent methyltransferase [Promethearchaeota archaeon]
MNYWRIEYKLGGKDKYNQESSLKTIYERYCKHLNIDKNTFSGKIVVDVGCGPRGSLHYFNAKLKIGVDPFANFYRKYFKVDKQNMIYVHASAERIPINNEFADYVISHNALDHVDNFNQSIKEIHRILKPEGKIIFQLNFNKKPTINEPIVLNKAIVKNTLEPYFEYQIENEVFTQEYRHFGSYILIKGKKINKNKKSN